MIPAEQQIAADRFRSVVRSLNKGSQAMIVTHLKVLLSEENERLIRHHELHKIHRAQGGVSVLRQLLETIGD